ncbi:EscV/YscV/HrcV family type III secretion system export apparatus protein [Noviherbaspirillum sp. 17J57-3]|uniref:EscV/YscV/HrcV family type III secretion system export apparatus protein n=1 Tax=Noviherbaspirillum galbum TaxID=2709383 RepID=A0A6B3SUR1_9BURK|nr:EscV/YscV/HrcV family type III secretion system export apparatus protein [Noviherbaspirillum galbum]
MQSTQRLVLLASQRADVVFAVILMAVVFMLILPLPTALVDVLVAINIAVSALLLMVAMYLPSPLAFSSFPSVLLITTLFRLALSIATTRLILLQADAGHIIRTFGDFVVGGNLVVGLVIFLILTVVQFIVITKGAERVAEVAARFSLDAMPGKQMSIDGDMRAGAIDMNEARRRRSNVEKESQLYGAMDGAMKFVKGDAIASIIIVAVNLIGGLLVGTMQHGKSASEAMRVYSVLTIGDGLIAQIPALLISITAGMIVTRVTTSGDGKSNIGRDISNQIIAQPYALLIAGSILFGFSLVPGMPTAVFLVLALLMGGVGYVLIRMAKPAKSGGGASFAASLSPDGESQGDKGGGTFSLTVPLMVDIADAYKNDIDIDAVREQLASMRQALYLELGVPFPDIQARFSDKVEDGYAILVQEIPVARGKLRPGSVLARESERNLDSLNVPFVKDDSFMSNIPTHWVDASRSEDLAGFGVTFLDSMQIIAHHAASILRRYASEFVGVQESRFLISKIEDKYPDLVKELQRLLPPQRIGEILQRLVAEGVSIRNLRGITEAMIEWGQKEKDVVLLTEHIRTALKRQISYKCAGGQTMLPAYLLTPKVEEAVRNAVRQTSAGSYLALDPAVARTLVANIKKAVGDLSQVSQMPVLLTNMDIRRYIRKMIEQDLFELPVVSYQELSQEIHIHPLARIELH